MRLHIIRHGMTEANEKCLYCGQTDLSLSESGEQYLFDLKKTLHYPNAGIYITSNLKRAIETLYILYDRAPDIIFKEFNEINFGKFEMKSHDELLDDPDYQSWINDQDNITCAGGESRDEFYNRLKSGLGKLRSLEAECIVLVCHGGVIAFIMETFFPGKKNFYEWQPDFGRGYTVDIVEGSYILISDFSQDLSKNRHSFFCNNECKYFPCHKMSDNNIQENNNFNCLFCYCPLYFMGDKCGGNFKYSGDKNIKDCKDCNLPHIPEYYDVIISKLKESS